MARLIISASCFIIPLVITAPPKILISYSHQDSIGDRFKSSLIQLSLIAVLLHLPGAISVTEPILAQSATSGSAAGTRKVRLFLIAIDDAGRAGQKIGCGDSLVAVIHALSTTRAPLRATLEELLQMPQNQGANPELYNALHRSQLKLQGVSVRSGVARIDLTGQLITGGVCDSPRVQAQLEQTALQFPAVKKVRVFINGAPLSKYLSEQD